MKKKLFKWELLFVLLCVLLLLYIFFIRKKEGFENIIYTSTNWPEKLINAYVTIQQTMNPNIKFDMNIVQQQATRLEGEEFIKNGSWTWNNVVQQKYKNAISKKDMIKTNPDASLINAQKIYNQNAIRELLIQNDKYPSKLQNSKSFITDDEWAQNNNYTPTNFF